MKKLFVASGDAKGTRKTENLPAGRLLGLLITLKGTTVSGQTLTLANCGRYLVKRNGIQRVLADAKFLVDWTDIKFGKPARPSGSAATAETVSFMLPFFTPLLPNTMDLQNVNEGKLELEFPAALATVFGANPFTYEVYAVIDNNVPQRYEIDIRPQAIQASGAGKLSEQLGSNNITDIFMKDTGSDVDTIQVLVDSDTVEDNTPVSTLKQFTNIYNRVEVAGQIDYFETQVLAVPNIDAAFNRNTTLSPTFNGAGTLDVFTIGIVR